MKVHPGTYFLKEIYISFDTLLYHFNSLINSILIRFQEMFPDVGIVREVQQELDTVIEEGVVNIVNLLKNQVSLYYQHAQGSGEST